MPHSWPADTKFQRLDLVTEDRNCPTCQRFMQICDHRHHNIFTLNGPVKLVNKLMHCSDKACASYSTTFSAESEMSVALPHWAIGWDVFAWIGQRRYARHWSVPQIWQELKDTYEISLSEDAIEDYVRRYEIMLAARHQDPARLIEEYATCDSLLLSIDGLQPEKGHETLYVVRELRLKRVWFAQSLISSAEAEIRSLLAQARQWAETLGKPVSGWVSDKQDAFVKTIACEFPGVPHRYCQNHFLLDLAQPMLADDSHAKVQMRRKVRGLRKIERDVLNQRRQDVAPESQSATVATAGMASMSPSAVASLPDSAGQVVLDYCSTVRGILNDDQGGPLNPPSLRMAGALGEVRQSLQRNLDVKKKWPPISSSNSSPNALTKGWRRSPKNKKKFANKQQMSARSALLSRPKVVPPNNDRHGSMS